AAAAQPRDERHGRANLLRPRQQVPGLDLALEPDRQRLPATVERLARGDADPALADAVLLHVAALHALEADADAAVERGLVVMRAARIVGQAVGRSVGLGVGHGMRVAVVPID